VELLTDLLAIDRRLAAQDPHQEYFPKLHDVFFDMSGYTVETLFEGRNCLEISRGNPAHFKDMKNLRTVARGALQGLVLLARAGVVHCDMKADNIMWLDAKPGCEAGIRLVDFGCARLDRRVENGRNWALAEGGAGHLGKWAPEMMLRLPITDRTDVWGLAVSLLEIHCGRALWCGEDDTVEAILAQVLGLTGSTNGLPEDLLRRSPLDITRLYTPWPQFFPVRRIPEPQLDDEASSSGASLEEMRPAAWGLACVLGPESSWDETKRDFAGLVKKAMHVDHEVRPSAEQLVEYRFITGAPPVEADVSATVLQQQQQQQQQQCSTGMVEKLRMMVDSESTCKESQCDKLAVNGGLEVICHA
jgi:serine/threonine protein kinase